MLKCISVSNVKQKHNEPSLQLSGWQKLESWLVPSLLVKWKYMKPCELLVGVLENNLVVSGLLKYMHILWRSNSTSGHITYKGTFLCKKVHQNIHWCFDCGGRAWRQLGCLHSMGSFQDSKRWRECLHSSVVGYNIVLHYKLRNMVSAIIWYHLHELKMRACRTV